MKKYIGVFIFLGVISFIFIMSWFNESNSNPFDYVRITDVEYKAEVVDEYGSNGKIIVTERLTFDIHAASKNNLFWELWRDLPEEYVDGVKVSYKVNYVKQIYEDAPDVTYKESPKLYWFDDDYINTSAGYGPGKWYHSKGPYDGEYNFECVLFYVDGLYRETVVFEIQYEMYNASLRYLDSSELYISLYSGESTKYLKSFKGEILFPNDKMPSKGNYDAYTYGTNAHEFDFIESDTKNPGYHTFSFELDKHQLKFKPYNQYIEFALVSYGDDKHIFTKYAQPNNYSSSNMLVATNKAQAKYEELPETYKKIKVILLLVFSASTLLIIKTTVSFNKKMRKKYTFYKPSMEIQYFRDIPSDLDPNFAATLVFCKHRSSDNISDGYGAVMLSLVHKGYIELEKYNNNKDWVPENIKIVVKNKPTGQISKKACSKCGVENIMNAKFCFSCSAPFSSDTPVEKQDEQISNNLKKLTPSEEQYYNLILRHSHSSDITLRLFQQRVAEDYSYTNSFVTNIKNTKTNIGLSQGYFQNANYKKPKMDTNGWALLLVVMGIMIITIGNWIFYQTRLDLAFGSLFILGFGLIGCAIHLNKIAKEYILLTQFGEDEYAKWRGLYNFLNSETLMKERTVIELVIWEQYLIYATAFGISEKVIKALHVRCPETNLSPVLGNPYFHTRGFYHSTRSFRTATYTASFTASSGGHGGYGGGGRGGGGGGGGH